MEFIGENFIRPDYEQIKKNSGKYIDFEDAEGHVWWTVIYEGELYFLFKREDYDDMPHEGDGIALTDDVWEVIDEIKEFYQIQNDEIDEDLNKEHLLKVLNFLDSALNIDGCRPRNFDPGIDKMKNQLLK